MIKAEDFHIDPERVFLMGHSSGGHEALLTALTDASDRYPPTLYPGVEYDIKGVIAESASSDIRVCAAEPLPDFFHGRRPSFDLLGIDSLDEDPERVDSACCVTYVNDEIELPPMLLFHSTDDPIVSCENTRLLFDRLSAHDKRVTFCELAGDEHGGPIYWEPETLDVIAAFMRDCCK